jgi:AcrR family transcriptional regulator
MRRRDDDKERRIKEAVVRLILEEGWNGASISKIARLASVSPATVYVYFDSKEDMLQEVYREYSEDVYGYLLSGVRPGMQPDEILAALVRGYYRYILENPEVFCFVEQFSGCPSLAGSCSGKTGVCRIYGLIEDLRQAGVIRDYDGEVLFASIFYPVKAIAADRRHSPEEKERLLDELTDLLERAILI